MLSFLIVACAIAVLLSLILYGTEKPLACLFLLSVAVVPLTLTSNSVQKHVGIASSAFELTTYNVATVVALAIFVASGRMTRSLLLFIPIVGWLFLGMTVVWESSVLQWSGVFQLLLAPAAWLIGSEVLGRGSRRILLLRFISCLVFALVAIQLVVCVIQLAGLPVNSLDSSQQELLEGRYNGTLGHPNDLGKIVILLMSIVLPSTRVPDRFVKRIAYWTLVAGFVVLLLTGGRAVILGSLTMLTMWVLLSPPVRGVRSQKLALLLGCGALTFFASAILIERFVDDPEGGDRSILVDLALYQINQSPWLGVGPNSYVEAVGQYSELTASGVPVHNAVLLGLAEIGLVGVIALALPLLWVAFRSIARLRDRSAQGDYARAMLSLLPPLYLIATTGWGLLGSYVLPTMFFCLGYLNAGLAPTLAIRNSPVSLKRSAAH